MYKNNKNQCGLKLPIEAKTWDGEPTWIFSGFSDYDCKHNGGFNENKEV